MNSAGETAATVAYQARGAGDQLASYAQEHPVQVAVTVGAFTWWMLRSREESNDWYGTADTSWDDDEYGHWSRRCAIASATPLRAATRSANTPRRRARRSASTRRPPGKP